MTLYDNDRIVTADKVEIKPKFETRYKKLLGDRYESFIESSFTYLRKCIRVNTLKIDIPTLKKRVEDQGFVLTQVPWCKEGFFVEGHKDLHRFDIGNLPEHTLGYFYVQEAASMIPPVVLFSDQESVDRKLDVKLADEPLHILDICAAPGSKTSQIAQYMKNEGVLIANDIDLGRIKPLTLNLQRMGVRNHLVTLNAFQRNKYSTAPKNPFEDTFFDKILVDAPCSGMGTIRRSFKTMSMYSYGLVERFSKIQKSLIKNAYDMLKPGGILVYSTCTHEPLENEAVVSHLIENREGVKILPIELDIVRSNPVLEFENLEIRPELKDALRIYPQDNDSEGFFVCKIQKN